MKTWKMLIGGGVLTVFSQGHAFGAQPAGDAGWYLGLGVGRSDARRTTSWAEQTDNTFLSRGVTSSTLVSSHDTAWKLTAGYRINENFAAEGGYTRIGRFGGTSTVTAPAAAVAAGTWDAQAVDAAIVGIVPITKQFSAFGKLGLAYSRLSVSVAAPGAGGATVVVNPNNARMQALVGGGLSFDITRQFSVRAEWERFNNVGDGSSTGQTAVDVFSLGGQFHF